VGHHHPHVDFRRLPRWVHVELNVGLHDALLNATDHDDPSRSAVPVHCPTPTLGLTAEFTELKEV